MRVSREISLGSSLHRASTDALKKKRYYCLAAALGEDGLVVVGGWSPKLLDFDIQQTNSVELLI